MNLPWSLDLAKVVSQARLRAQGHGATYLGTDYLLLAVIDLGSKAEIGCLGSIDLPLTSLRTELTAHIGHKLIASTAAAPVPEMTPRVLRIFDLAGHRSEATGSPQIEVSHLLGAILIEGEGVAARVLRAHGFQPGDFEVIDHPPGASSGSAVKESRPAQRAFRTLLGAFGQLWDETDDGSLVPTPGNFGLLLASMQRLSRNNTLLVGPKGIGKTSLVKQLAVERAHLGQPLYAIDLRALTSTEGAGAFVTDFVESAHFSSEAILFFDDVESAASDACQASILRGLANSSRAGIYRCVATCDAAAWGRLQSQCSWIMTVFDVVPLTPVSSGEKRAIVELVASNLASDHQVSIPAETVAAVLELADSETVLPNRAAPGKVIEVLQRACLLASESSAAGTPRRSIKVDKSHLSQALAFL